MKKLALATLSLIALGFTTACGEDTIASPTTPTPAAQAAVSVSVDPRPLVAQPSTDPAFQWELRFNLTVHETAGLGVHINNTRLTITERPSGTVVFSDRAGADDIVAAAGTNRVEALGSLTGSFDDIRYTLPGGGRKALATFIFEVTDDNAQSFEVTAQARIE